MQLLAKMGLALLVLLAHFCLLAFARLLAGLPLCILSSLLGRLNLGQNIVSGSTQHGPALCAHGTVDNLVGVLVDFGQKCVAPGRYIPPVLRQRFVLHVRLIHVVHPADDPAGTQPEQHPEGTTEDANEHSDEPAAEEALTAGIVRVLWDPELAVGVALDDRRALEFYAALAVKPFEGAQRLIRLALLVEGHSNHVHGHDIAPLIRPNLPEPLSARRLGWATPPTSMSRVISDARKPVATGMSSRISKLLG